MDYLSDLLDTPTKPTTTPNTLKINFTLGNRNVNTTALVNAIPVTSSIASLATTSQPLPINQQNSQFLFGQSSQFNQQQYAQHALAYQQQQQMVYQQQMRGGSAMQQFAATAQPTARSRGQQGGIGKIFTNHF